MLLVLAVMVGVTVAAATAHQFGVRRAFNLDRAETSMMLTRAAELWALDWLQRLDPQGTPAAANALGVLAVMPLLEEYGVRVEGQLVDAQSRLNINDLVLAKRTAAASEALADGAPPGEEEEPVDRDESVEGTEAAKRTAERLTRLIASRQAPEALLAALRDWLDEDSDTRYPDGGEDDFYLRLNPPYRTANAGLGRIEELLLVRGFTRREFERIAGDVVALPGPAPLNVNTATPGALVSLHDRIDRYDAQALIDLRGAQPFDALIDFLASDPLAGVDLPEAHLTVRSSYYLLQLRITRDGDWFGTTTLIESIPDEPGRIVWRARSDDLEIAAAL